MSALYFDARIDGSKLQRDINNINRQLNGMTKKFEKEGREIDKIGSRIGTALAGAFSVYAAGNFVRNIAQVRGEFQQLEVAFETMLASKEKADALMAQVVDFAATTPFELTEVAGATKQLLAYGIAAEDILPTLKALGDVSAGLSVPIERLILNYGQVRTQLKLTGRELRDFNVAGVPIVAELAKNLDVAEKKVQDMVSAGEIGFEEVKQAFMTMTQEGGKFNNLMDKQSKTITGLASNFRDAFDKMLNSIGESNEGIISGSIKGAIALTENYEKVIDVLKVLIATYGAYKAAVIAAAVARKAAAWGDSIRLIGMYRKELGLATATQQAFNTAAKANPYGLILAGISALVTAFVAFRKETKTTQDHIDDLNTAIENIGSQVEINTLVSKYDDLQRETELTKDEQEELNETVKKIGDIFPQAVTEVDNFGNAIELSSEKVEQLNENLRENAKQVAQDKINEKQEQLNQLLLKQERLMYATSNELLYQDDLMGKRYTSLGSAEDMAAQREELSIITSEIQDLRNKISELGGTVKSVNQVNAEVALEPYQKLFGDVRSYSEQQALDIKADLVNLLTAGLGNEANIRIKEEIDKISTFLGEETIEEKVKKAVADLKQAKADLEALRAPGAKTSREDIKSKQQEIDDLEEYIETYTGVKVEGDKEIAEEERKALQKRLKAKRKFADAEIELEREVQASRIAVMEDGFEKQKAEAELAYQQELDRINQQQEAYLEAYNAKLGYEPTDQGYITQLPAEQMARFDKLRVNAEQEKAREIEAIERKTAQEKEKIWSQATEAFISDTEREIKAIDEKYDKLIRRAKEAGVENLNTLEDAREREKEEVYINAEMRKLDFQERVEMQRAEIATQGFNREVELERKRLEIVKKIAKEKIEVLKDSGEKEAEQDITMLELIIDAANKGLKDLSKETLSGALDQTERMVAEFKNFSDAIFGADSQASNLLGNLSQMASSVARIAAGDYSGAVALFTQFTQISMDTSRIEKKLAQPWIEFEKWIAASNRELERYIKLRDDAIGYERYETTNDVIAGINEDIESTEEKLSEMSMTITRTTSGWFGDAYDNMKEEMQRLTDLFDGRFVKEKITEWGAFGWSQMKGVFSFDLDQLLFDDQGDFTLQKINELIDEGHITDQKVIEAVDYYQSLVDKLGEAEREKQELLTSTMADNIADGIIDGFKQGYDSAADFAEDFEELMKNAILNAVKIQTLEEPLQEWYRQFADYSESGDVLTEAEIASLEQSYDSIIEAARERYEEMKRIAGLNFDANGEIEKEGLTGAIKGITEETAGLIAGQFFAFRELQSKTFFTATEQLDGINQSIIHLAEIAANTRHNAKLNDIDEKMSDLNNYLKDAI